MHWIYFDNRILIFILILLIITSKYVANGTRNDPTVVPPNANCGSGVVLPVPFVFGTDGTNVSFEIAIYCNQIPFQMEMLHWFHGFQRCKWNWKQIGNKFRTR